MAQLVRDEYRRQRVHRRIGERAQLSAVEDNTEWV
jgi:hypothetical protein